MIEPTKVEMRPAYEWTCENCGRNNFESCIVLEMTDDERQEQLDHMGLGDNEAAQEFIGGHFVTSPEVVTCKHCGSKFETYDMEAPEE